MIIPLQKMILKSMTQVKRTGPISKMLKQLSLKTWRADTKTDLKDSLHGAKP